MNISTFDIVNVVATLVLIVIGFGLAKRVVRNSQRKEQDILANGSDVNITILSMKQSGLFINNNPVIEMSLRVEQPQFNKSWLVEKHNETAWLIAVAAYQSGNVYQGKLGQDDKSLVFVKDGSGKPLPAIQQ
ncbi:hypothetical protein ACP3S7_10460 [Phytobacter ursingii]